jgi:hypothetical protein
MGLVIVSMFQEDLKESARLASTAFMWARSWLEVSVLLRNKCLAQYMLRTDDQRARRYNAVEDCPEGEREGHLPWWRVLSRGESSTIWILCYVRSGC